MLTKEKVYKITRPLVRTYFYILFTVLGLHVISVLFSNLSLLQTISLYSCLEIRNNLLSDCFDIDVVGENVTSIMGQVKVLQDQ